MHLLAYCIYRTKIHGIKVKTIGILREYYVGWLLSGLEFHSNPGSSQPT
jgi:hypothetical protein